MEGIFKCVCKNAVSSTLILSRMPRERNRVELKDDGVPVEGRLTGFDEKMNLVLEDEYPTIRYGRLIIRGSSD